MSTVRRELWPDELLSDPMLFTLCLLVSSELILFRLKRKETYVRSTLKLKEDNKSPTLISLLKGVFDGAVV